jgi:hypothetical protein
MLLEDEHGQVNLIVPKDVYERHRGSSLSADRPVRGRYERVERNETSSASQRASRRSPAGSPRPRTSSPPSRAHHGHR